MITLNTTRDTPNQQNMFYNFLLNVFCINKAFITNMNIINTIFYIIFIDWYMERLLSTHNIS